MERLKRKDPGYANAWAAANREHLREYRKAFYIKNLEKSREDRKKYDKENRKAKTAREAKRRAKKLLATLDSRWDNEIKEIYENCPEGCHVDHVVPLQGKEISGLHVPWNLQYLTAEENIKKSNKIV